MFGTFERNSVLRPMSTWTAPTRMALLIALTCTLLLSVVSGQLYNNTMSSKNKMPMVSETLIIQKMLSKYDNRVRPQGFNYSAGAMGGPVIVTINMLLRTVTNINDINMEFSAQITFREQWRDPRLAFGDEENRRKIGLPPKDEYMIPEFVVLPMTKGPLRKEIWMPDTFFQNEKEARKHDIDKMNVLIRIYADGSILYSVRMSLVYSCPMRLELYPMDQQTCTIEMASYAYTTQDIEYIWKSEKPVQFKDGVRMDRPAFDLSNYSTDYCTSCTNTGCYGCLRCTLVLHRLFSYYLIQVYTPSIMLVVVSWVSFWLDSGAIVGRTALGVTTLLTMTAQSSAINAKLPPVGYTKAIDVWVNGCLAFIFSAFLEFAYVAYVGDKDKRKKARHQRQALAAQAASKLDADQPMMIAVKTSRNDVYWSPAAQESPDVAARRKIDVLSRDLYEQRTTSNHHQTSTVTFDLTQDLLYQQTDHNHFTVYTTPGGQTREPIPIEQLGALNRSPVSKFIAWLLHPIKLYAAIPDKPRRADMIARVMFPTFFIMFNVAYWSKYQPKLSV